MRPALHLTVALLVVLAGCGAGIDGPSAPNASSTPVQTNDPVTPTAERTGTPTSDAESPNGTTAAGTTTGDVRVVGGDLPVDAALVYDRVQRLLGTDGPPVTIRVRRGVTEPSTSQSDFHAKLGIGYEEIPGTLTASGRADRSTVSLRIGENASAAQVERVLVHELVHVLQISWETDRLPTATKQAVAEGTAVYATSVYVDRYDLPVPDPIRKRGVRIRGDDGDTGLKLLDAPYYYGARYADRVIDDPTEIRSLFETPPRTTEQLLHPTTRRNESAAPLRIVTRTEGRITATAFPTRGELLVRVALGDTLGWERGRTVSTGWGNDRLVELSSRNGGGFVWVTRWDTPRDARQFRAAMADYVARDDGFGTAGRHVSLTRPANRTVVFVVGDRDVVNATRVTVGPNRTVTVHVGNVSTPAVERRSWTAADFGRRRLVHTNTRSSDTTSPRSALGSPTSRPRQTADPLGV